MNLGSFKRYVTPGGQGGQQTLLRTVTEMGGRGGGCQ